jgi:hypothetical protein
MMAARTRSQSGAQPQVRTSAWRFKAPVALGATVLATRSRFMSVSMPSSSRPNRLHWSKRRSHTQL